MIKYAFLKKVCDTVKQYAMLNKGDRVLVAVSGGADSVCLLKALLDMRGRLDLKMVVANMDHGLRGEESARDSRFVEGLAQDLGIKFVHKKTDIKGTLKKGFSVEEYAREKRYTFLMESAASEGCNVIATGHTMDDQAETILMRLIYGASASGIMGIPPVRHQLDFRIIRPLIRIERREILSFLMETGLGYVEDSSNSDTRFLRNKVRFEVLPFLEKYNPRIKRALVNLADTLRDDMSFISKEKEKYFKECLNKKKDINRIKLADIMLQPKMLRKELFKELFKRSGGNIKKLTYRHWMDMDYFLRAQAKNKSLHFPGSIKVTKTKDEIVLTKCR